MNSVYQEYELLESFSTFSRFQYMEDFYYLTEAQKLQNDVQLESNVMLTDDSMTPLSILPLQIPESLGSIIGNYTSPQLTRINDTVAITFEHMNETEANGTYEFSEFVYFVDLPYIEAEKEKHDDHEEEEKDDDSELRSIVTQIIDVIVQLVKWVAKKFWG